MEMSMSTFTLYWKTGDRQVISNKGKNIADAMTLAGYSNGAVPALDFWASGDNTDYEWNQATRNWDRKKAA